MPKPYVPTGRPPGRPPKPAVEKLAIRDVVSMLRDTTVDRATRPMDAICPDCFPEGWSDPFVNLGPASSASCQHGSWIRRL